MNKTLSFLIITIILTLFSNSVYAEENKNETLDNTDSKYQSNTGIFMPVNVFNELYGQPDSTKILPRNKVKKAKIDLREIVVEGNRINFSTSIYYGNQRNELNASGKLFKSYKQQDGINSIVGEIKDKNNNFEILLFEIYNDNKGDRVITNEKFEKKPHLKIYLKDDKENILLFETEIPDLLTNVKIFNDEKANVSNDGFWFINVIEPYEIGEIPTDAEMLKMVEENRTSETFPMAVGSFSDWAHSTTYSASFYVGSDHVQAYSLPYGSWKALNVTNQSTWTNSFKIAEHVKVNGKTVRSLDNPFKYRNVRLATAVGAKSTIIRAVLDGSVDGRNTGGSLPILISEKLWAASLPSAPSLTQIRSWISALGSGTSKTITLGKSNVKLNSSPTVVEQTSSGTSRQLFKNTGSSGHQMILQTDVQYDSSTGTSATANGIMDIRWSVYYNGSLHNSNRKEVSFGYNVKNN